MSQYNKVITLLDGSFAVYGDPIAAWESLAYSDAWDKHGTISLVAEMDYFAQLSGASWMEIDGRVYEVETITSEDADSTVKVTGCSLNVLFDRIVITAKERLQGRLEERIRYLVNKYAITGTQAVTGLELGTDNAYARAMDATTIPWQTLSEFLYTQLNQRGFSYEITCDCSTGALVFNITQALDRTQDQTVNPPVQLSTTAEIEKATYKKSIKDFRNYAIVHDDDPDNPQVVEVDLSNGAAKRVMTVSGRAVGADESEATNLFVMVGATGKIWTSTDGITWASQTSGTTENLYAVDYVNGNFAVGAENGKVLTSIDATTWAVVSTGSVNAIEGVTYDDGMYFAFDSMGNIYYSYDASTWTYADTSTQKIVNSVSASNRVVTFSAVPTGISMGTSYDGKNWKFNIQDEGEVTTGGTITRTVKYKDIIVAVGFVTVSGTNYPATSISSDDGITHTPHVISSFSGFKFLDAAVGKGLIVAIGQTNKIAYSYDGITWTDCTPADTIDYIAVAFNGTNFYAYGYSTHKVAISSDGINWTTQTTPTITTNVDAVTYGTSSHSGNLYQVGVDALQSSVVVEALDGDVNQELAPEYEIDYNIGDVIDTLDPVRNIAATKRVYSVDHIIDKNNDYAIVPKLGKDFLTLRQLIAKEIKNNGI